MLISKLLNDFEKLDMKLQDMETNATRVAGELERKISSLEKYLGNRHLDLK